MADNPVLPADDVAEAAAYRKWLVATLKGDEWQLGSPWPESDEMFGTCWNDDCQGIQVMLDNEVGAWHRSNLGRVTVWHALCRPCAQELLNDGSLGSAGVPYARPAPGHNDGRIVESEGGLADA